MERATVRRAAVMAKADINTDDEPIGIGTILDDRYRIDAVLGRGGMGCVYRAVHTGIGRSVAIKVLRADLGGSQEAGRRFKREALASGRLDHPNIVGVSDFGVLDDGSSFLVMEALEGESLGDRIDRESPLPWIDAVEIMRGILRGLHHAHERGVVHRDIKPDNIFLATVDERVVVKILDFGIAKLVAGSTDDLASTRAGMTMGTPVYLSPEQAVGGAITPATDLYSATVVFFEMLTGRTPFADPDLMTVMMSHVSRPPPTLAECAPDRELPARLESIVQRGLEKLVGDRVASAEGYLALLDSVGSIGDELTLPSSSSALGPVVAVPPPTLQSQPLLPLPSDAVSLPSWLAGSSTPIPRKWIIRGAITIGAAVALSLIIAIASGSGSKTRVVAPSGSSAATPAADKRPIEAPDPEPEALPDPVDREVVLKALLHDLQNGKTCDARRLVIPKLVELGDPRAIPSLKGARYRMYGGVLGFGASNANACLTAEAEKAIRTLVEVSKEPR